MCTKVIIFSTDNLGEGAIMSLEEVSNYCKLKDIKVYPIGARTIQNNPTVDGHANTKGELVDLATEAKIIEKSGKNMMSVNTKPH